METPLSLIAPAIPVLFVAAYLNPGLYRPGYGQSLGFFVLAWLRAAVIRTREVMAIVRWARSQGVGSTSLIFRCARMSLKAGRIWT